MQEANVDPQELARVEDQKIVMEEYGKFNRPVPGQSLTNDPENPAPYEKAPQFTSLKKAQEFIFEGLIDEETYVPLMELLASDEATIMELTQNLLYQGFRAGKWNPDMMLMLAEPTAYMFMALAEKAGIDYRVDDEPDEDEVMGNRTNDVKKVLASKAPEKGSKPPAGAVDPEIIERLAAEAPEGDSLLEKPEAPMEESLMTKPTEEIV